MNDKHRGPAVQAEPDIRAEVKAGKRKVVDYFLNPLRPLREYADESLKER